jgi:hypothetical protein
MFVDPKNPYKPVEFLEARRLRREEGMPMKQIALRLGVSPGSVHLWTKDIEIDPKHAERNARSCREAGIKAWVEANRALRQGFQDEGRARARLGEPLHQAGCMLYWAEGSKGRNSVVLANSDPHMVRFFRKFLVRCFDIDPRRFAMSLNVYVNNGLGIDEIERFWLNNLELPRTCVRKHIINHYPTSSSGMKMAKLPYGTCHFKLHDTRIVQHIYGAIQEYAGFEEPQWLDGPPRKPRRRGNTAGG